MATWRLDTWHIEVLARGGMCRRSDGASGLQAAWEGASGVGIHHFFMPLSQASRDLFNGTGGVVIGVR